MHATLELHDKAEHFAPVSPQDKIGSAVDVVIHDGPLRIAGDVFWVWLLRRTAQRLPGNFLRLRLRTIKHLGNSERAFFAMP